MCSDSTTPYRGPVHLCWHRSLLVTPFSLAVMVNRTAHNQMPSCWAAAAASFFLHWRRKVVTISRISSCISRSGPQVKSRSAGSPSNLMRNQYPFWDFFQIEDSFNSFILLGGSSCEVHYFLWNFVPISSGDHRTSSNGLHEHSPSYVLKGLRPQKQLEYGP